MFTQEPIYKTSLVVQWLRMPANAGDMGLIPGLGRSHMFCSNKAHVPQLLSPPSRAHAVQQEKTLQRESCILQLERAHSQ